MRYFKRHWLVGLEVEIVISSPWSVRPPRLQNMIAKRIKNNLRRLRTVFQERIYVNPKTEEDIIASFHKLYYDGLHLLEKNELEPSWLGTNVCKYPFDLWVYQEILFELHPDLIIECGTRYGGSALFFASICDLLDYGHVLTIDVQEQERRPQHSRITYLTGSSTSSTVVSTVAEAAEESPKVLVCLDSDHQMEHVLEELRIYSQFVNVGSYVIVEDSNVNGHPVYRDHGPGPMEAIERFLEENDKFVVDKTREKFLITFNPKGYLKRIK